MNLPCNDELSTSSLLLRVYRSIQNADLCSSKQNLGLCIISDWVQGLVLIFGMGQSDGPPSIRYEAIKEAERRDLVGSIGSDSINSFLIIN